MNDDAAYSEYALETDRILNEMMEEDYTSGELAATDWDARYEDWSDECMYDSVPF
jgi:hypothetical protein